MKTVYACWHIEKEVEEDNYKQGCIGKRTCIMSDTVNFQADTLKLLFETIGNTYGLDIDDLWTPQEDGILGHVSFNRLENLAGEEPDKGEKRVWKMGKLKLYIADYTFLIEKRIVSDVPMADFVAEKIKTHE